MVKSRNCRSPAPALSHHRRFCHPEPEGSEENAKKCHAPQSMLK
jgi:hypothetical protein